MLREKSSATPGCGEGGSGRINFGGYGRSLSRISCFRGLLGCRAEGSQDQRSIQWGQHWAAPAPEQSFCIKSSSLLGLHLSSVATGTTPGPPLDQHHSGHKWAPLHLFGDIASSAALFACLFSWALSPRLNTKGFRPNLHLVSA